METHPGEGVMKEEKFPNSRKPSHRHVCGEFWNLKGQHNQEEKKKKTPQTMCNYKWRWRSGIEAHDKDRAWMPWGQSEGANVRQQPKPWAPQRQEKKTFPSKGSNNTWWPLLYSHYRGLSKYQRTASWLLYRALSPWRQKDRHVTARAGRQRAAAILAPETTSSNKLSRLPVANHVFLGSWTVDICQEYRSLRSASQRRHMAYLGLCSHCTPGKPSSQDLGGE